jgi:hypothetical protein
MGDTTPRYVVCEQYPGYSQHVRELPPGEDPIPGGYSRYPRVTMCGRSIRTGWDTPGRVPREKWLRTLLGASYPCAACHDEYLRRTR